jgi:acyl-CoA thioesterase-2
MDSLNAEAAMAPEGDPPPEWDGRNIGDLLDLARVSDAHFRSQSVEENEHGRIFGGQILGQALYAASRTVPPDRSACSMQLLFAAGGLVTQPIDFEIATIQEGKRFSARHVRASQTSGRIVCDATATFARAIASPAHAAPAPADCGIDRDPEGCARLDDVGGPGAQEIERVLAYMFRAHKAIDMRAPFVEDLAPGRSLREPRMRFWIRLRQNLGDDSALHAAAFAYLSDYWINFAVCIAHVRAMSDKGASLYVASLNHAIWFHRPLRADEWLLFDCTSPSGAFGRGLAIARVYSHAGSLVASATQECLLAPGA